MDNVIIVFDMYVRLNRQVAFVIILLCAYSKLKSECRRYRCRCCCCWCCWLLL